MYLLKGTACQIPPHIPQMKITTKTAVKFGILSHNNRNRTTATFSTAIT